MSISTRTDLALQVCFGIFSILGTIATLASLHHRDSLGCILIRRWLPLGHTSDNDDVESLSTCHEDEDTCNMPVVEQGIERRTTAPPAYESVHDSATPEAAAGFGDEEVPLVQHKSVDATSSTRNAAT